MLFGGYSWYYKVLPVSTICRRVVAFPDLGAYDYWIKKAQTIDFPIEVSNYIVKNVSEAPRKKGLDIADFL